MFLCRPQTQNPSQATIYTLDELSDVVRLLERHYG